MTTSNLRSGPAARSRGALSCGSNFLRDVSASRALQGLLVAFSALACEGADYAGDSVESAEQAIYQGTVIGSEANTGVVRVNEVGTGVFCSGTLLKNDWVLTAAHCVDIDLDWNFAFRGAWNGTANGDAVGAVGGVTPTSHYYAGSANSAGARVLLFGKMSGTPGAHDPTFDGDGRRTFDVPNSTNEQITAITTQSDGKLVGVGFATVNGGQRFLVVRLTTTGALDTTFNGGGYAVTDFSNMTNESANSVVIDSTGKIVVGGRASDANGSQFALVRYNTNGSLDTTFDTDGRLLTAWTNANVTIHKLAKTSDSKIVAVGTGTNPGTGFVAIARYNHAGALDTTFDTDGRATIGPAATGRAVIVDTSNRVVVGGSQDGVAKVWRLTAAGALDTTFNLSTGYATPTFNGATATSVFELTHIGGINPIRAITRLKLTANDENAVGVSEFSSVTGQLKPHQIYPGLTGKVHELANNATLAAASASFGAVQNRVILAGTDGTGATSRVSFIAAWPERTSFTPIAAVPYPFEVEMDNNVRSITAVRLPSTAMDIALLRLNTGIPMGVPATTTGYTFPGFSSKNGANVPFNVECRGYGRTALDGNGTPIGGGSLHRGTSRVLSYDTHYAHLGFASTDPANQQLPFPGDSGSSCRDTSDGNKIVSVHSKGGNTAAQQVPAYKFSAWALDQID